MKISKKRMPVGLASILKTVTLYLFWAFLIHLILYLTGLSPSWIDQIAKGYIPDAIVTIAILGIIHHFLPSIALFSMHIEGNEEELVQTQKDIVSMLKIRHYMPKEGQPNVFVRKSDWYLGNQLVGAVPVYVKISKNSNSMDIEGSEEIVDILYGRFKWKIQQAL